MIKYGCLFFALLASAAAACSDSTEPEIPVDPLDEMEMNPYYFNNPAWHPGGEWIAVDHGDYIDKDGDGVNEYPFAGIWLVHAETGVKQPLIEHYASAPAWNSDGTCLAMRYSGGQIYTVNVLSLEPAQIDSNSIKKLTEIGNSNYPDWSPKNEWIVFDRSISDNYDSSGIWITSIDGINENWCFSAGKPSWHPYEQKVISMRQLSPESGGAIFILFNPFNVPPADTLDGIPGTWNSDPCFSPDGTEIAFYSIDGSSYNPGQLCIMDEDGGNVRVIISGNAYRFDWSPDGGRFVFLAHNYSTMFPGNGDLWLVNRDGTGLKRLTFSQK